MAAIEKGYTVPKSGLVKVWWATREKWQFIIEKRKRDSSHPREPFNTRSSPFSIFAPKQAAVVRSAVVVDHLQAYYASAAKMEMRGLLDLHLKAN